MAIPSNPLPEFCAACGFPLRGARCEACGVERATPGRRPAAGHHNGERGSAPEGTLGEAHEAEVEGWRTRDPVRFVGHCVTTEVGSGVPATSSQEGVGWIFQLRGVSVFVSFDPGAERVAIDAPVARVPERQRVPALRAALELSEHAVPARLCLRDDLLVLRRVARLSAFSAPGLRRALRSCAEEAERLSALLATWFDARAPFTEEQRASLSWASAGRSRPLKSFSIPPPPARSLPPPPPASHRPVQPPPPPLPPLPPISGRGFGGAAGFIPAEPSSVDRIASPDAGKVKPPESAARPVIRDTDGLPDILSPLMAGSSSAAPSSPAPAPDASPPARSAPSRRPTPPPVSSTRPPPEARPAGAAAFGPAVQVSGPPVSVPVSVRPPAPSDADAERERMPADRFCQLLRDAQAHATAVSFQDRPGVMLIVIRSTVFRAILEHSDTLPHAVAHLYRATAAVTRDLAQAEAAGRRVSPAVMAEPALHAMERLVSARGHVPDERPLTIEPLTSAAHAREHLSRYLREIERAPVEPALRHFLALGALSELLVRARLPAKTDQRLREIVSYAHRDGPKAAAIDLMMTALNRIIAQ